MTSEQKKAARVAIHNTVMELLKTEPLHEWDQYAIAAYTCNDFEEHLDNAAREYVRVEKHKALVAS